MAAFAFQPRGRARQPVTTHMLAGYPVPHVRDRREESETLQVQAQSDTLAQFSASPDLHDDSLTAIIGTMESSANLSAQILNNKDLARKLLGQLLPSIYRQLKTSATGTDVATPSAVGIEVETDTPSRSESNS